MADATTEKKVHYPSILSLDEGDLPEIKDWKVGETYSVELEVKMISQASGSELPSNDTDKEEVHGRFEVLEAEVGDEGDEDKEEPEEDTKNYKKLDDRAEKKLNKYFSKHDNR